MHYLNIWYALAGVALLAMRFPRLKEWAYTGLVFLYTARSRPAWRWTIPPSRWWARSSSLKITFSTL